MMRVLGIQLALRILPHIPNFQQSSIKTDLNSLDQRLANAGLLVYNSKTCTLDDIIQIYEDLFLITGSVRNIVSLCIYEAPIFIRRSLSKHGLKLLDGRSNTKILIIPKTTITSINRNDFFTDSSLIHYLLTHTKKQDFHPKEHKHGLMKNHSETELQSENSKHRTSLIERMSKRYSIGDEHQPAQKMANIHRFSTLR